MYATQKISLKEELLKKERKILLTIHKAFIFLLCLFLSNSILILQRELETVAKNADDNWVKVFFELKINSHAKKKNTPKDKREETSLRNASEFRSELNL